VMADRSGIEIDYCPTCRGVWLDRGELDKIIERNAVAAAPVAAAPVAPAPVAQAPYPGGNSKYHSKYHQPPYKKKKSSMLGDLFDF
jgi:Zn-finger nucleic acid-binding protein